RCSGRSAPGFEPSSRQHLSAAPRTVRETQSPFLRRPGSATTDADPRMGLPCSPTATRRRMRVYPRQRPAQSVGEGRSCYACEGHTGSMPNCMDLDSQHRCVLRPAKRGAAGANGLTGRCLSLDRRRYAMAMKFLLVLKPRAARLAFCISPFMASTNALERPCCMPAITPSQRVLGALASRWKSPRLELP